MASLSGVGLSFLVCLTGQLVRCGHFHSQVLWCKEKVWAPNFLHSRISLFSWQQPLFGFTSQRECQAAMCVPKCKNSSPSVNPTLPFLTHSPQEEKSTKPTILHGPYAPQDEMRRSPEVPNRGTKQVKELQAILGFNSRVILNKIGEVIGIEAPAGRLPGTNSRPGPHSETFPGDDASICCST